MNKKAACVLCCLLIAPYIHTQSGSIQGDIVGKWLFEEFLNPDRVIVEFTENIMTLSYLNRTTFYDNNKKSSDTINIEYRIENNKLVLKNNMWLDFSFSDPDTLTIFSNDVSLNNGARLRPFTSSSLNGKYILADMDDIYSIVQSIEFISGKKLRLTFKSHLEIPDITGKYKIRNPYLLINIRRSLLVAVIISENVLHGDPAWGMKSIFIKRE